METYIFKVKNVNFNNTDVMRGNAKLHNMTFIDSDICQWKGAIANFLHDFDLNIQDENF